MNERPLPLSEPYIDEREADAAAAAVRSGTFQGGGPHLARVEQTLRERFGARHALMTTSCTHALETCLAAHGVGEGDEVIVPTFTHTSTANAPLSQGARIVFADSMADSPHVDPAEVERKITDRTRAVIAMHYGGIPHGIAELRELCTDRGLILVEDAAQSFDARFGERYCGTLGDGGCISFHDTKNVCCGEGGLLLTDDDDLACEARIIREMGTDRAAFRNGGASRYTWRRIGSSYIPSDLLLAVLEVQLSKADEIFRLRRRGFDRYRELLAEAEEKGLLRLPVVPEGVEPNGHIFHVLLPDGETKGKCQKALNESGIGAAVHFHPLHSTPFGRTLTPEPPDAFPHATRHAETLLRLPLYARLSEGDQDRVVRQLLRALNGQRGSSAA